MTSISWILFFKKYFKLSISYVDIQYNDDDDKLKAEQNWQRECLHSLCQEDASLLTLLSGSITWKWYRHIHEANRGIAKTFSKCSGPCSKILAGMDAAGQKKSWNGSYKKKMIDWEWKKQGINGQF